jgi:hypothetical protein
MPSRSRVVVVGNLGIIAYNAPRVKGVIGGWGGLMIFSVVLWICDE